MKRLLYSMFRLHCLVLLVVMLALSGSLCARADQEVLYRGDALSILGESSMEVPARHIREVYPEVRKTIEEAIGWPLLSRPTLILTGNAELFGKMSGSELFSAFALPSRATIVIHVSPSALKPYALSEIFEHELCHLLLHDHIEGALLPKWLDEGVCQWISGSFGEILSNTGMGTTTIDTAHRFLPLKMLSKSFPKEKDLLLLSYLESRRFVEYISAQHGRESLLRILDHLKEGRPIDEAMELAVGKPLDAVEDEWLESIRSRSLWLVWASQHLYDILFLLASVLTVVGFARMMIKRRRRFEDETDEE